MRVLISEPTRPLIKNDNMQRIKVNVIIKRDNWSTPYLPYMKRENFSFQLMIGSFQQNETYIKYNLSILKNKINIWKEVLTLTLQKFTNIPYLLLRNNKIK